MARVTPGGFERYSTGSPELRRVTPWYVEGRKPLDQLEVPPLVPTPELSTTKPGRVCDSLPRPYSAHAPMVGRPTWMLPPKRSNWPGWWLKASVYIERTRQRSSAQEPMLGMKSESSMPLLPYGWKVRGLARTAAFGLVKARRRFFVISAGRGFPCHF